MAQPAIAQHPYEAYLALEAESDIRYEFHDGFIVAMAGGTPVHSQLGANVVRFVGNALDARGKKCLIFNSDLKVHIEATNRTFYPDVTVACESPIYSKKDLNALTNPILIVEVLSESTADFDRGLKFSHYRRLPSLREYVLISQGEPVVDTYFRTESGLWEIHTIIGLESKVELKSIGCTLKMEDIYRLVPGMSS